MSASIILPLSIREENPLKKPAEDTPVVGETRPPVITSQAMCFPPPIFFSQEQLNDCSIVTKVTPMKKLKIISQ
jgi:hypothetical protein